MPYIDPRRRTEIILAPDGLVDPSQIKTVGELNFAITRLMVAFVENNGGVSYTNCSGARAAAHDAALEMYRRVLSDYEDHKCRENGDVYEGLGSMDIGGEG